MQLVLSFDYVIPPDAAHATLAFAFCYPYAYEELCADMGAWQLGHASSVGDAEVGVADDAIYLHREVLTHSLEARAVELLTITSFKGRMFQREAYIEGLFPEHGPRPWRFGDKKVFWLSARVHPGETPSSHVMKGCIEFLLSKVRT